MMTGWVYAHYRSVFPNTRTRPLPCEPELPLAAAFDGMKNDE
jgi:hypothetical protein